MKRNHARTKGEMMKKILSLILTFVICLSCFQSFVFAQGTFDHFTDAETENIYSAYLHEEHFLDALFTDDTSLAYWSVVNSTENNGFISWAINIASRIIGEYPDKKKYAEILANLIMTQTGSLTEQIQNQAQYDDLKNGADYFFDVIDIADSFVGGAYLFEEISPIIDAATGGKEVLIENIAQAKYYETSIKDYAHSKMFLEAISNYAKNEELRDVADSLLSANDELLERRLEYLNNSAETIVNYESEFFVKNLCFELLKTADIYKTDEVVKWYIDCGDKISKSIQSIFSAGAFAFKMTMLAGDIGFGTSNTYNRYQEMKILSDISGAIVEANRRVKTPSHIDSSDALNTIQTKCDYYRMLITTHARGEYLVYQLLVNDSGFLADYTVITDTFKESGDTTESWYNKQTDALLMHYDILSNLFSQSTDKKDTSALNDDKTSESSATTDEEAENDGLDPSISFSEERLNEISKVAIYQCMEKELDEWIPDTDDKEAFWDAMCFYCDFTYWIYSVNYPRVGEDGQYQIIPNELLRNAAYALYKDFDGNLPTIDDNIWRATYYDDMSTGITVGDNAPFNITSESYAQSEDGTIDAEYVTEYWDGSSAGNYKVHFEPNSHYNEVDADVTYYYCVSSVKRIGKESVLEDNTSAESSHEEYQEVINEYRSAYDNFELYQEDSSAFMENYPLVNVNALIEPYLSSIDLTFFSAIKDINGDNVDELIVGVDAEHPNSIYTFYGGQIIPLINDIGERSYINIYDDGTIYRHDSGGASFSIDTIYEINESGDGLSTIKQFEADWDRDPDYPYYDGAESLSQEQFNAEYLDKNEMEFNWSK